MQKKTKAEQDFLLLIDTVKKQLETEKYMAAEKTLAMAEAVSKKITQNKENAIFILNAFWGEINVSQKKYKMAIERYQKILSIKSANNETSDAFLSKIYSNIALSYYNLDKFENAFIFFEKEFAIIEILPEDLKRVGTYSYAYYTDILIQKNKFEEAIQIGEKNLYLSMQKENFDTDAVGVQVYNVCMAYANINKEETGIRIFAETVNFLDNQPNTNQSDFRHVITLFGSTLMRMANKINKSMLLEYKEFARNLMDKYLIGQ